MKESVIYKRKSKANNKGFSNLMTCRNSFKIHVLLKINQHCKRRILSPKGAINCIIHTYIFLCLYRIQIGSADSLQLSMEGEFWKDVGWLQHTHTFTIDWRKREFNRLLTSR